MRHMTDGIPAAAEGPEGQVARGHVVECDADGPEVDGGAEGLSDRLAQHGALVHVGVEVLLGAVEGDELLVVLQLARRPEVGQLVHDRPVVLDELHDVARLQVPARQGGRAARSLRMLRYYIQIVFITLNMVYMEQRVRCQNSRI